MSSAKVEWTKLNTEPFLEIIFSANKVDCISLELNIALDISALTSSDGKLFHYLDKWSRPYTFMFRYLS